ncbi:MAG: hypothetical protein ACJA08_001369 [Cyclobacteriaceae bacterium]|jgi:hypothetical protein
MTAYSALLHAHSGFRWLVLLVLAIVLIKSLIGLFGGGEYSRFDKIMATSFVGFMDLQLLIGLILYFISPIVKEARSVGMGNMMADSTLRFWGMEHLLIMILAVAAAHIGSVITKKAEDNIVKFRFQSIFFGVALLLMLIGIPWDRL